MGFDYFPLLVEILISSDFHFHFFRFVNVQGNGKNGCVLLENPAGDSELNEDKFKLLVQHILGLKSVPTKIFSDEGKKTVLQFNGKTSLSKLHGTTVYV